MAVVRRLDPSGESVGDDSLRGVSLLAGLAPRARGALYDVAVGWNVLPGHDTGTALLQCDRDNFRPASL